MNYGVTMCVTMSFVSKTVCSIFLKKFLIQLNIHLGTCKNYETKCVKPSNIHSQKKVWFNKMEATGRNNW